LRDAVLANAHLRHRSANRSDLSGSHEANVGERIPGAGCVRIRGYGVRRGNGTIVAATN
jgi:hypothetical protein